MAENDIDRLVKQLADAMLNLPTKQDLNTLKETSLDPLTESINNLGRNLSKNIDSQQRATSAYTHSPAASRAQAPGSADHAAHAAELRQKLTNVNANSTGQATSGSYAGFGPTSVEWAAREQAAEDPEVAKNLLQRTGAFVGDVRQFLSGGKNRHLADQDPLSTRRGRLVNKLGDDSTWLGKTYEWTLAGTAATNVVPHYYNKLAETFSPWRAREYGTTFGESSRGGRSIDLGPLGGFEIPFFDPATKRGLTERVDSLWEAREPGVTHRDIDFIKAQAAERGYREDRHGLEDWISFGKRIFQSKNIPDEVKKSEMTYNLADKATRYGTTTLAKFAKVIEQTSKSADKANVSFEQMLADMDALGEINQSQGGTHEQGGRLVDAIQSFGLPAGPVGQAMAENPFVQSRAFRSTGLMPWQQGLMSPGERLQSVFGSIYETYDALSGMPSTNQTAPGRAGELGGRLTRTGRDVALAELKRWYPELSIEQLRAITNRKNRKALETLPEAMMMGEQWSKDVGNARSDDQLASLFSNRSSTTDGRFTWGDQAQLLREARTVNREGRVVRAFSDRDISNIARYGSRNRDYNEDGVINQEDFREAATRRHNAIQRWAKRRGVDLSGRQPQEGPKIVVELGTAARKALNISTRPGEHKENSHRAEIAVNAIFGDSSLGMPPVGPVPGGLPTSNPAHRFFNDG